MVQRVNGRSIAANRLARRTALALAALAPLCTIVALSGCGSGLRDSDDARADVDAITHPSCAATALQALGGVATRVYREGISSERTASALGMI
jgi:hypothetical protein